MGLIQRATSGLTAWVTRDNHRHKGKNYMYESGLSKFGGRFTMDHYDKHGNWVARLIAKNGITDTGMNHVLDTVFHGTSPITTWYAGLIDNSGYTALAAGDTMGTHGGWNEFTTYSEGVRQTWTEGAAASRSMTNSTAMTFTISGTGTLRGAFLASSATFGAGTLFATGLFGSTYPVAASDSFKLIYTISG